MLADRLVSGTLQLKEKRMIRKLMEKINGKDVYNEAVKFCYDHKNPSVWALQEVFGLNYQDACKMRTQLVRDGYVELFERKKPQNNVIVIDLTHRSA